MAQQQMPEADSPCEDWVSGMPNHFCACRDGMPFQYPLEMTITDTMWFSSTVEDLKLGLSAYWIASSSITFEVYAFCASIRPTIQMTVGANQMREMSVDEINAKLKEMGKMAELMSDVLTPRIKVYPNGTGGKVYCYPYDQGPKSTCDTILRFLPSMTYVCDQAEEVYKLQPEKISSKGVGFIRWKQKNNMPATIRLTKDSCNGEEIANVTLRDSMHVFILDSVRMKQIKTNKDTVYVHVTHDSSYVGRVVYRNSIKWDSQRIDTTLCQGKGLQLPDTTLTQSTVYPNDILFKRSDTLSVTTYYLTVEEPNEQYDTLRIKASQLPYSYRNQYIIEKDGWGDHTFTIRQSNQCDDIVHVYVEHVTTREETVVNDTLCMGKTATYGGVTYVRDTVIRDSLWADADTWLVRDITIHFTEPEMEYDTIAVAPSKMTDRGYFYQELAVFIKNYGDTLIVKTKKNTCTRWIQLHVEEGEEETHVDIQSVPYETEACKYLRDGMIYIRREGQEYDLLGRPVKRQ